MIVLGLAQVAIDGWNKYRTRRVKCLTCGAEVQAHGDWSICQCADNDTRIAISGDVFCEEIRWGHAAQYVEVGR